MSGGSFCSASQCSPSPPDRARGQAGFTILEVLIATTLGALLVLFIISQNATQFTNFQYVQTRSGAAQDAVVLVDYLSNQARQVGGQGILAWMGVWAQDGTVGATPPASLPFVFDSTTVPATTIPGSPNQQDRLILTTAIPGFNTQCTIQSVTPFGPLPPLSPSSALLSFYVAASPCCLAAAGLNNPSFAGAPGQQIMLLGTGTTNAFSQQTVTIANVSNPLCNLTVVPGPAAANPNDWSQPQFPAYGPQGNYYASFVNGVAIPVQVTAYYYYEDPTYNGKNATTGAYLSSQHYKLNSLTEVSAGEGGPQLTPTTLADQVFDFQVALGFDVAAPDQQGWAADTSIAGTNEWMYNALSEGIGTLGSLFVWSPPSINFSPSQLIMVEVGVVVGTPHRGFSGTARAVQLLNGKNQAVTGWDLWPLVTKVTLRNSMIFN